MHTLHPGHSIAPFPLHVSQLFRSCRTLGKKKKKLNVNIHHLSSNIMIWIERFYRTNWKSSRFWSTSCCCSPWLLYAAYDRYSWIKLRMQKMWWQCWRSQAIATQRELSHWNTILWYNYLFTNLDSFNNYYGGGGFASSPYKFEVAMSG